MMIAHARPSSGDGGPGLSDCFNLTLELNKPALSRMQLMKRTIFNVLIGNCDAHAKNFSLLHRSPAQIELAPAYDLVSTRYYPELTERLAMRIGGSDRISRLYAFQWKRFCEEVGIGFPALRKAAIEMQQELQTAIQPERDLAQDPTAEKLLDFIERHASSVVQRLELSV